MIKKKFEVEWIVRNFSCYDTTFFKLNKWSSQHHPRWLDALRILTGLIIHLKTLLFLMGTTPSFSAVQTGLVQGNKGFIWTIGTSLMIGGTLLILGLGTRIICLLLLPCIIAAAVFSGFHSPYYLMTPDLLLSILLFFLVGLFFIEGSGKFSVDYYMRHSANEYVADRASKSV